MYRTEPVIQLRSDDVMRVNGQREFAYFPDLLWAKTSSDLDAVKSGY